LDIQNSLIVAELKRNGASGIRLLVEKYQNPLYAWGRWQYESISDQDLIEIIEDTFTRVIEKIDAFQFTTSKGFKNWVFTIFSRLCIDQLRKEKRIAGHMQVQSLDTDASDKSNRKFASAQFELDRKIFHDYFSPKSEEHPLADKVRGFMDGLDEKNRVILQGCADGFPHREIAIWAGIPVEHVKVYYSRLKKKLEKYLIETEDA